MRFPAFIVSLVLGFQAFSAEIPADHPERMARGLVLFQRQVRQVLIESCLQCHGGEKTKGAFDLATREGLLKGGTEGASVVPFQASESRLLRLVRHAEEPHMPEKKAKLPEATLQAIAEWIDLGAPFDKPLVEGRAAPRDASVVSTADKAWWSFKPLGTFKPPSAPRGSKVDHPIDRFILAKAAEKGLKLSRPADARSLIRRASLDLTGLPPGPDEVRAFTQNHSKKGWERLVDRLLDSPRYGERWARHWLDVARFAESSGFEHDYDREGAFHYRDFVIKALNADLPYDRFIQWQLAGDEFAADNPLAMTATGFLGAGVFPTQITANEVERTRYDAMDDMLSTSSAAFLGLTVGCARCHDHKFDPIPTADYYRMLSTFTTTVRSVIDLDLDPESTRRRTLQWEKELKPISADLALYESRLKPKFESWLTREAGRAHPPGWVLVDWTNAVSKGGAVLRPLEDGSRLAEGKNADQDEYTFTGVSPLGTIRALRLDALADPSMKHGGPGRADNGNFALSRIRVFVAKPGIDKPQEMKISSAFATFQQNSESLSIAASLDNDAKTGWAVDPQFGKDHSALFRFEPSIETVPGAVLTVKLEFQINSRHSIGRPRLSVIDSEAPTLDGEVVPLHVSSILARASRPDFARALSVQDRRTLFDWWKIRDTSWRERAGKRNAHLKSKPDGRTKVLVCAEGYTPLRMHSQGADFFKETYLLKRGNTDMKEGIAPQAFLQVLARSASNHWTSPNPPSDAKFSGRRSAMARWMTDVEHGAGPLAARVAVNRLWQHHFGEGLVRTPNDFGKTGEKPSHPELLDWLAGELIRNGWRLKPVHKLIMTSDTYRQSTLADANKESLDPENRLFTRRLARRLEGEAIRDSVLEVSGAIDRTMFGKGTMDEKSRRRSIYFTIKRSQLVSSMVAFDLPEPLVSQASRPTTTVAPQALFLMNGPQVREWAARFARSLESESRGDSQVEHLIDRAFWRALGRAPTSDELAEAARFIITQTGSDAGAGKETSKTSALADFCQVLFGLNEFAYMP